MFEAYRAETAKEFFGEVDMKARAIKKLENEYGFTREEAIFLVMDEWYAIATRPRTSKSGK